MNASLRANTRLDAPKPPFEDTLSQVRALAICGLNRQICHSPRPFIQPWIWASRSLISSAISATGRGGV